MTEILLQKLHSMGVVNGKHSLEQVEKLTVSAFCRRRLPVVMVEQKFCENVKQATGKTPKNHLRAT